MLLAPNCPRVERKDEYVLCEEYIYVFQTQTQGRGRHTQIMYGQNMAVNEMRVNGT